MLKDVQGCSLLHQSELDPNQLLILETKIHVTVPVNLLVNSQKPVTLHKNWFILHDSIGVDKPTFRITNLLIKQPPD